MNQVELENLPYPMFETTREEKEYLWIASTFVKEENHNYFLCNILEYEIGGDTACELKHKVCGSLKDTCTLSDFLGLGNNEDDTLHAELRKIWIRKLLVYKGE